VFDSGRNNNNNNNNHKTTVSRILLLAAGYPDDHSVFVPLASRLAAEQPDCITAVTCLPGFDNDTEDDNDGTPQPQDSYHTPRPDGYTFPEIAAALREAAKVVKRQNPHAHLSVIFHDWAVVPGLLFVRQALREDQAAAAQQQLEGTTTHAPLSLAPDQMVLMDVLFSPFGAAEAKRAPLASWYKITVLYAYQHALVLLFVVHRDLSQRLARWLFPIVCHVLCALRLFPLHRSVDRRWLVATPAERRIDKCYIYWQFWKAVYSGEFQRNHLARDWLVPLDRVDLLFLYGTDKVVHFHDSLMVEHLNNYDNDNDSCHHRHKAVGVPNAGHWFFLQQPDLTFHEVRDFCFGSSNSTTTHTADAVAGD